MSLPDDVRLRPVTGVSARVVDEGDAGERAMLVDLRSGRCWELNRIGHEIWRLLAAPGGAAAPEIVAALARRYPTEAPGTLETDVRALMNTLRREGLLESQPPP